LSWLNKGIISIYEKLFVRKAFYNFNKRLFYLSLRGIGVLNYKNDKLTGEEHFLQHSLPQLIPSDKELVVLDVGANEGHYACKVKETYPNAEIFAFEPHPKTFARLQSQAAKHGFQAFNLACGEKRCRMELYDRLEAAERGTTHASLYKDIIEQIHGSELASWSVQVIDLDYFIKERGIQKVNFLKIDTEGHELSVLLGAQDSIKRNVIDVIQFEFNEMNVISRVLFKDFYDMLSSYVFFRMLPDGLVPLGRYTPLMYELFAYQNIVAVPERSVLTQREG
jgi:FkbM family methyltransferase